MKRILLCTASLALAAPAFAGPNMSGPAYTPDLLPPVSNAGECYARVKVPAQYETYAEPVMTTEAHTRPHVAQAKLASRQEQVMVKEPSVRFVVRQPSYRTVTEQVLTRPSYDKLSVTPPQYQTVTETVQTSAPRLVWKKGNPGELQRQGYVIHSTADAGSYGQGYSSTTHYGQQGGAACGAMCEIWCLVEEPGETQAFSRTVMTSPGEVRRTRVPAVYQNISKQVVSDPGGVSEVPVPAEYRTITVEDVVEPAREALIEEPAKWATVTSKRLIAEERYEWRRVLCADGTGSIPQPSYEPSYSQPSYPVAPAYTTPSYAQPVAEPSYLQQYEGGKYCGDTGCASSSHSGAGHSGYYVDDSVVQGSSAYGYETGRHMKKRHRR